MLCWCGQAASEASIETQYKRYQVVTNGLSGPFGLTFSWWGCYSLCLRNKPTELAHSFYCVLLSVSVFMALSNAFHLINSPGNSPLSLSVLLVVFLP